MQSNHRSSMEELPARSLPISYLAIVTLVVASLLASGCSSDAGSGGTPAQSGYGRGPEVTERPRLTAESLAPVTSEEPTSSPPTSPTLIADTFATVTSTVVPVSERPGDPPWRFDTGDPDPSTHPLMGFGAGFLLVVLEGPVVVDGVEWYLFTPAQMSIDVPTGWSPISAPDGTKWIVPATVHCPVQPRGAELAAEFMTVGLIACYGSREVTITGSLACRHEPDPYVVGANWLATGVVCHIDDWVRVYGLPSTVTPGAYVVTGHFDDQQSSRCVHTQPTSDSTLRLMAITECRRSFVASSWQSISPTTEGSP